MRRQIRQQFQSNLIAGIDRLRIRLINASRHASFRQILLNLCSLRFQERPHHCDPRDCRFDRLCRVPRVIVRTQFLPHTGFFSFIRAVLCLFLRICSACLFTHLDSSLTTKLIRPLPVLSACLFTHLGSSLTTKLICPLPVLSARLFTHLGSVISHRFVSFFCDTC